MPIIGLTDRGVAFPEIGHIRKGGKKQTDRPGEDLHYFRIELDEREEEAARLMRETYKDAPDSLNVILPFDDIERVWDAWREAYVAGAMTHRCNGKHIAYAINPKDGTSIVRNGLHVETGEQVECNLKDYADKTKRCRPTGRLKVIMPVLRRMAYLTVHTTSVHDIINISEQLAAVRNVNHGHIAGVPLLLRRRPVEISTPSGKDGQRARRVKWLISIEADPEWVARSIDAMKLAAMPELPKLTVPRDSSGPSLAELNDFDDTDELDRDVDEYGHDEFWADMVVLGAERSEALEALNDAGGHYATAKQIVVKKVQSATETT